MVFEAPDGPLGLILAASWANQVAKMGSKMGVKSAAERYQKMSLTCFTKSNNKLLWFNFWFIFGLVLVPILKPILGPKIGQNLLIFGSNFGSLLLGVLEVFGCLLGAFLGLLRLSWEASRAKKCRQSPAKTTFLKMQLFGSLKLLMALLGSSCPLFGRSGPKMGPKMVPKRDPKSDQKMVHKSGLIKWPYRAL